MHKQLAGLGFMILSGCTTAGGMLLATLVGTSLYLPNRSRMHGRELLETHMRVKTKSCRTKPIASSPNGVSTDSHIYTPSNGSGQQISGSIYTDCSDDDDCTPEDWLFVIKLGCLSAVLLVNFFVLTQCTRFAVHFSFCINTRGKLFMHIRVLCEY